MRCRPVVLHLWLSLVLLASTRMPAVVCANMTAQNDTPTATPVTVTTPPTPSPVPTDPPTPSPSPSTVTPPPTTTSPPPSTTPPPTTVTPEPTTTQAPTTTPPPTQTTPTPTTTIAPTPLPEAVITTDAPTIQPMREAVPTMAKEVASSAPPASSPPVAAAGASWKFYVAIAAANVAVVAVVLFVLFRRRASRHRKTMDSFESFTPRGDQRPFDSNSVDVDLMESSVVSYEVLTPCENIVTSGYSSVDPSSSMRMSKLSFMSEGDEPLENDDLDDMVVLSHPQHFGPDVHKARWSAFNIRPEFPGNISTTLRATYPSWQERLSKGSSSHALESSVVDDDDEPPTPAHDPAFPKMLSAQSNWSQWQDGHSFSGHLSQEDDDATTSSIAEWHDGERDSYMTDDAPRISLESAGVDWHLGSADDWRDSRLHP
ncbi:hypothetical protein SDRG_11261 [Saprolegnia diclina VS20]|uniref:Transmembrane protein n=1 Tax=Saprolegnia diclina (strain VS20) TaxID=1156394 RepID=T0QC07_SAPDV|nr:hypothetical protein SDRG_11261 [Saprolegnia diclina VS20]EQC31075.1 hypothetical protein SDRG_11261 [Saprolegnia diclina VS20]|eukprot:XP_008615514.1 hypothetical protein SDRG_11261 [Saprolegnia diclina VS20]